MSARHRAVAGTGRHRLAIAKTPSKRQVRTPLAGVFVAVLAAGSAVLAAVNAGGAGAASTAPQVIASDHFARTTAKGLGRADVGGTYTLQAPSGTTSVRSRAARVASLHAGGTFLAGLPSAKGLDTRGQTTFVVPARPVGGRGLSIGLVTRNAGAAGSYYAKLRIDSAGGTWLSFSDRQPGHSERFLDNETRIGITTKAGQALNFETETTGTGAVQLHARVWASGSTAPAWQLTAVDSAPAHVRAAGAVGLWAYVSASSKASSVNFTDLTFWNLLPQPTAGTSSSPTTGTSSTSPSAPTSSSSSSKPTPPSSSSSAPSSPSSPSSPTSSSASNPPPTGPPPSNAEAGAAAPGDTAYPVPSGALFVAPNGSDSNSGTQSSPFRTLGHAVAAASSGSTIVLRAGTYHETVQIPSNKSSITIQSAPHEAVYLDGSVPVTNWSRSGSTWVSNGWTATFDYTSAYSGSVTGSPGGDWINSSYPMAAHPDQMFMDGKELTQVGSAVSVAPGTFYADYANKRLIVGDDPGGKDVRATDLTIALTSYGANTTLRGIAFRRYATEVKDMGAVRLYGTGAHLENVSVNDTATTGIAIGTGGAVLSHVTTNDNGLLGIETNYADGMQIDETVVENNNAQHFNQAPVAGGIKIHKTRTFWISHSVVADNLAAGIWMDQSNYDARIYDNTVSDNAGHGIFYEISSTAIIANNVVVGNGGDGLKINDSDKTRIWNNRVVDNGRNMEIVQDTRIATDLSIMGHDPRRPQPDPAMTWLLDDVQVMSNLIGGAGDYDIYARDYTGKRSASQMHIKIDGNVFTAPVRSSNATLVWGTSGTNVSLYKSASDIAQTGAGSHNAQTSGAADTLTSQRTSSGLSLPSDIAALTGAAPSAGYAGPF